MGETEEQEDVSFLSENPEKLLLPTSDYNIAIEQLQENVQKAKHLADQQQQRDLRQGHYPMQTQLVAPLTSNKAFNEKYRRQNPIVKRSNHVQPNSITDSIAAGLAAAASAMNNNKRFNPLTMPAVDPFADTPPLTAAVKGGVSANGSTAGIVKGLNRLLLFIADAAAAKPAAMLSVTEFDST